MKNFRELNVWKKSRWLLLASYKATEMFPKDEGNGLKGKIRNSCVNILANLTRGFGGERCDNLKDFLKNSICSVDKLDSYFQKANNLHFLNNSDFKFLKKQTNEIMGMLVSFLGCGIK